MNTNWSVLKFIMLENYRYTGMEILKLYIIKVKNNTNE